MGKEVASAIARWCALENPPGQVELVAVADVDDAALGWFERIPTVDLRTKSYSELLARKDIDVVYAAVPHDLHESIYMDVIRAGKDLFAEKPFGIDLRQSMNLALSARTSGRFVRCSSEFPFYPGALRIVSAVKNGDLGRIFEVRAGFWHSSDLDPEKPINWKRQKSRCGEAGVMNDLGLHVWHIPLRLGWKPNRVHAQLQNIIPQRRDANGQWVACDTDDNAIWNADCLVDGREVAMRMEAKRIMPGETNTWFLEIYGEQGSIKFSTKEPKTLWTARRNKEQVWERVDLGHQTQFPVVTGGIFEFGFPDAFLQMWAAFLAERAGQLGNRFGCATPEEAVAAHSLNEAALQSARERSVVSLDL
jgi:predicted dehydrogenase